MTSKQRRGHVNLSATSPLGKRSRSGGIPECSPEIVPGLSARELRPRAPAAPAPGESESADLNVCDA
eukprot:4067426-Pyramimonas_sp.AAC.1